MGNSSSMMLQEEEIQKLQKDTGFSRSQILRLYNRFLHLDKNEEGHLSREDFLRIPELAINPLGDRIVHAFFKEKDTVNFTDFISVLAVFRPIKEHQDMMFMNSIDHKLQFAFNLYDLDGDGYITKDELLEMLHMMVGANISEEQLTCIADRTIIEADHDGDKVISFDEFKEAMAKVDVDEKMSIRFLH